MGACTEPEPGYLWEVAVSDPGGTKSFPRTLASLAGLGMSGACVVCGLGVLVLSAGMLATCWRLIDVHERQQQDQVRVARDFHADLIRQMHALVGRSAASVTDDLCRVRFRLRLPERETSPAGAFHVSLLQNPGPDEQQLDNRELEGDSGQIADFGLLTPGRYRLLIEDRHRMRCRHDFTVQQGEPVDRIAYCPRYEPWMFREGTAQFRLHTEWPAEWESRPIVAVVHLRSAAASSNGWHWHPPEDQQFDACVCLTGKNMHGSWASVQAALPESVAGSSELLPVLPDADARPCVVVPYACCEVYGVSFLLAASGDVTCSTPRHLETVFYDDPETCPLPHTANGGERIVVLSHQCCRRVCDGSEPAELPIRFPDVVVASVLHYADQPAVEGL